MLQGFAAVNKRLSNRGLLTGCIHAKCLDEKWTVFSLNFKGFQAPVLGKVGRPALI